MTTELKNSDGLVGENLRQNVLLAATTPETLKSSKIDIALSDGDSDSDKDGTKKKSFWKNLFSVRENLVKSKNTACVTSLSNKCDEKSLNVSGNATSKRTKNQIDADKIQIKHNDPHSLDDTGDCISELIGHIGTYQIVWVIFLIMFQVPSAFHIFSFMFQVNLCVCVWLIGQKLSISDSKMYL